MNLHDEIMRIPCDPKRSPCRGVSAELAYKSGHRDARHAAAELAAAAEQPDTARTILTDEDMRRLRRFHEICEDSDAGGHDLPKEAVQRLERAGALRSCGFGRHEITLFGDYLLGKEGE